MTDYYRLRIATSLVGKLVVDLVRNRFHQAITAQSIQQE